MNQSCSCAYLWMAVPTWTCVQLVAFKIKEQSTDVLESVVIRGVHRATVAEEQVFSCQQVKHVDLSCTKAVVVIAHQDVLRLRDKRDILVGVVRIGIALLQSPNHPTHGCTRLFSRDGDRKYRWRSWRTRGRAPGSSETRSIWSRSLEAELDSRFDCEPSRDGMCCGGGLRCR